MENGAPSQRKNILERNKSLIRNILDAVLIFTIVSLILVITFYEIQKHEYKEITTKVGNKNITPTSHVHVHEQVHLSLGVEPNSMTIAWLTLTNLEDDSLTPTVKYSDNELNLNISIKGITKSFFDMSKSIKRFVHKVELKNLKPNTRYFYQVGDTKTWSKIFNFKNLDINSNAKVCFFGDMDATYNGTTQALKNQIDKNECHILVHVGDIAYHLFDDKGTYGDRYMNTIEQFAAYAPYMVIIGNHELEGDTYEHYNNIFAMPYDMYHLIDDDHFYSFSIGNVNFIALNSVIYKKYAGFNGDSINRQYKWLKGKLNEIKKIRDKKPWIIVYFHHPIYCCDSCDSSCINHMDPLLKDGIHSFPGLEKILYQYKVDLIVNAHVHAYIRAYPVYNNKIDTDNNSDKTTYKNPKYPTQIITGIGGSIDFGPDDKEIKNETLFKFGVVKSIEYGFTKIEAISKNELKIEHISSEHGTIIDHFRIRKDGIS